MLAAASLGLGGLVPILADGEESAADTDGAAHHISELGELSPPKGVVIGDDAVDVYGLGPRPDLRFLSFGQLAWRLNEEIRPVTRPDIVAGLASQRAGQIRFYWSLGELDSGEDSQAIGWSLPGVTYQDLGPYGVFGVETRYLSQDGYIGPQFPLRGISGEPGLNGSGAEQNKRTSKSGDDEPESQPDEIASVFGKLPIYLYILACLLAGSLIYYGTWLCCERRFAYGSLLILAGGALWLCDGFSAIGRGPFGWLTWIWK